MVDTTDIFYVRASYFFLCRYYFKLLKKEVSMLDEAQELQLEDVSDSMKGRYLTFALGEEVFGISINFVKEIIGLQPINPIPEAP